ncbi:MAG: ribosome small subunit-dependent GTPase A [Actinomycetia bacterium]|nr:ribosome small subunit-dependent GTPase A [Actinomycetes bacterium]
MELRGQLVALDRSLPLVRIDGEDRRAEYAAVFRQSAQQVTIGDWLLLEQDSPTAPLQITQILPRQSQLVRRICLEHPSVGSGQLAEQVLAANFSQVLIIVALGRRQLDLNYLERQLVLALESGQSVAVVLNKTDLAAGDWQRDQAEVRALAPGLAVVGTSVTSGQGLDELEQLCPAQSTSVLFGRSGVGKSSLINALCGHPAESAQAVGAIRQRDEAGRHTTVARRLVFEGQRGYYDLPGLRSLGVYQAESGLAATFAEIDEMAGHCRFRNCEHREEPGCAVRQALQSGQLTERRLNSFLTLAREVAGVAG